MTYENNISSINTQRGVPPNIHGIRSNRSADPRFNPNAPAFVRKGSTEGDSTPSKVVEPFIKYEPNTPEFHGYQYGKSSHDPIKYDRGREYMSHWHNPNPLSGTSRLPPPSMGAPRTVSSSRSRSSTIQYSPPCRPYHNAVMPSPIMPGGHQVKTELLSNAEAFDTRLEYLQNLKKELLAAFKEHSKTLIDLTSCPDDLCRSWQMPDANSRLSELYRRDGDAGNTEKLRDEFGQGVKSVEEEIEELWGDFKVPGEARAEEEIRFWNWKDEVPQ